ncbi:MAG: hypothetical protein ABEI75_05170 [Halobaculum sp.]
MGFRRRTVLVTTATATAGCAATRRGRTDSTPTAAGPTQDCPLNHQLFEEVGDRRIAARYQYGNLPRAARSVFDGALDADGETYRVDRRRSPAAFRYTDVVTYYVVRRNGTRYVLGTWSGEGC